MEHGNIDWRYPPPGSGFSGALDRFIGPGATSAEIALQSIAALAAVAAPLYAARTVDDWTVVQYIVCGVLALDITGGTVTNATSSAKRWYHRSGRTHRQHLAFVALHLAHLGLVAWLFPTVDVIWALVAGTYLLLAAAAILRVPLYLQRPTAMLAYAGSLVLALLILASPAGLEWFLPLFYLKLLVSHLVREEPYRPAQMPAGE